MTENPPCSSSGHFPEPPAS